MGILMLSIGVIIPGFHGRIGPMIGPIIQPLLPLLPLFLLEVTLHPASRHRVIASAAIAALRFSLVYVELSNLAVALLLESCTKYFTNSSLTLAASA
jgi:hypothetical protein